MPTTARLASAHHHVRRAPGYTVAKLGRALPVLARLFTYLIQGFGNGRVLGIAA